MYLLPQKKRKEFWKMNEKTNERIALETEAEMLIAKLSDAQIAELLKNISSLHRAGRPHSK